MVKIQHSGIICTSPGGGSGYRGGIDWDELNAMYAAIDDINEAFGTDITELCSPTTSR